MIIDPMQVLFAACIGLFFLCFYLVVRLGSLKNKLLKPEIRYVDTSGIIMNPPRQYIDVWQGKTINFKLDDYVVCISQVGVIEAVNFINIISAHFLVIQEIMEIKKENEKIDIERTPQQKIRWEITSRINNIKMLAIYNHAIKLLYKLSIKHVNTKSGYRTALLKHSRENFVWGLDVIEQINDYWQTVKKKINLQARGETLKQTAGYSTTWQDLQLDSQGNRLIVPVYG